MSSGTYPLYKIMELKYKYTTLPEGHPLLNHINLEHYKKSKPSLLTNLMKNGDGDVYKIKFREMINKLRYDNITDYKKEIISLNMINKEHLEYYIKELMQCLLRNHQNPDLIVAFIICLHDLETQDENTKFKVLLVLECQKNFEQYIKSTHEIEKDQICGLFILIGELYNKKIIPKKVVSVCLQTMLQNITKNNIMVEMVVTLLKKIYGLYVKENKEEVDTIIVKLKSLDTISLKEKFVILDFVEKLEKQ